MIVTIDGPAGAGKSSISKSLAQRLGFAFLDTGAMYRAVTVAALRAGHDWSDAAGLVELTRQLHVRFQNHRIYLNGEDISTEIRTSTVTGLTHYAANNPGVRECLVEWQRAAAEGLDLVTEGRDQGTVVFPYAELKLFLTATPVERARRRLKELLAQGEQTSLEEVLAKQNRRDASDSERAVGPLRPAADAIEIYTDGMSPQEVEERLEQLVCQRRSQLDASHQTQSSLAPSDSHAAVVIDLDELVSNGGPTPTTRMREYVWRLPKAELHLHIEGTLEPELLFSLAQRNKITLPYDSPYATRAAYQFADLQSFLDLYYLGMQVLRTEEDFFDLTWAYLTKAAEQGVRHAELFVDPQAHAIRGVPFATAFYGITAALDRAERELRITSQLIPCFLRDRGASEASAALRSIVPYRHRLIGVGLDSAERDHPPSEFASVFADARKRGFLTVAHAGEEGPASYIREALDLLQVRRIDHGVRCVEDPALVDRLREERIPLTVCPLSNLRLQVCPTWDRQPIGRLLEQGLMVTVNSDDPAYFGGYVADNYWACHEHLGLDADALARLAENSIRAAFLAEPRRAALIAEIAAIRQQFQATS